MSKSVIRTGGTYVGYNYATETHSHYTNYHEEEGRFTAAVDCYKVGSWAGVANIYSLLAADGKAYKQFMKACQRPIGDVI